ATPDASWIASRNRDFTPSLSPNPCRRASSTPTGWLDCEIICLTNPVSVRVVTYGTTELAAPQSPSNNTGPCSVTGEAMPETMYCSDWVTTLTISARDGFASS